MGIGYTPREFCDGQGPGLARAISDREQTLPTILRQEESLFEVRGVLRRSCNSRAPHGDAVEVSKLLESIVAEL